MKKIFTTILTLLAFVTANAQHGEYVGGDISMLPEYEEHNSAYLDGDGNKIDDLLTWFMTECGWNTFRVRLFVNPTNADHDGAVQDIEYVKKLGKRIKDAGANFVLDFHYSDTWADAGTHKLPSAWSDCTTDDAKAQRIYDYTKESLAALIEAGATPDFVQVGNEIMYGFAGIDVAPYDKDDTNWEGFLKCVGNGCKAVREACPQAKIIIHTDRPCNASYNKYFYGKLDDAGVDYDVIGLSYYPFWHGTLVNFKAALNSLKTDFPSKKVQIVETAYNMQYQPSEGVNYNTFSTWAATADGQYNFVKDLIEALADYDNINGLYYWFPEEAGNGDDTDWNSSSNGTVINTWLNRGLWWEATSTTGHWPVKATDGMVHYLFKNFLSDSASGINNVETQRKGTSSDKWYTPAGMRVSQPAKAGMYINGGKKYVVR